MMYPVNKTGVFTQERNEQTMDNHQTQEYWIQTDHGRLYARRWTPTSHPLPAQAPIVLLHDSLGCVDLWRDFPARLSAATGRSVIAYDRLGFGRSDPHPGMLPPRHFIHDEAQGGFRSLREALGIERFVVFGHSVGGGMAVACAASAPDDCVGLITESAQAFPEDHTLQGIRDAQQHFAEPGQVERLAKYHGAKAQWVLHAWIDSWLSPAFADWRLDDDLSRVQSPALVLHGDNDEYGSVRHPERIARLVGGPVTLALLTACGHVPHREQEGVVLARIQTWLQDAVTN